MEKLDLKQGREIYLVGLTGNIACGKSVVVEMLRKRGATIIDADRVVHGLMEPGGTIYGPVVEAFGETILTEPDRQGQRAINRRKLGAIVFADPAELARLEAISHPRVRVEILRQVREAPSKVVVLDAIKLLENGLDQAADAVWVVTCPPEVQLERLMRRNNFSREEALLRIQAQPPQAEKVARADLVIDNGGELGATEEQVQAAWEKIKI
ncbi:MAG: Dephospho-CoA kinase [Chloroflexi bacterium]|jgi:dephospho-CoA kinase|nr:Dephospho-CoA kinase [Chloroflexota bacterium]